MWCALIGWSLSMGSKWNCTVHVAITSGIKVLDQCHYLLYQLVYIWMSFIGDIVSLQPIQHPYITLHLLQCKQRNVCAHESIKTFSMMNEVWTVHCILVSSWSHLDDEMRGPYKNYQLLKTEKINPERTPLGTPHIFEIVEIFCILAGLVHTRSL